MADFDDLDSFDNLDSLDDLGDLEAISFDDPPATPNVPATAPAGPAPTTQAATAPPAASPQGPAAAPMAPPSSGLGAVIYDLISKQNYAQVVQIAETQKDAIAQDPQVRQMVDFARSRLGAPAASMPQATAPPQPSAAAAPPHPAGAARPAPPLQTATPQQQPAGQPHPPAAAGPPRVGAPPMAAAQLGPPQPPPSPGQMQAPGTAPVSGAPPLSLDDSAPLSFDDGPDDLGSNLRIDPLGIDEAPPEVSPGATPDLTFSEPQPPMASSGPEMPPGPPPQGYPAVGAPPQGQPQGYPPQQGQPSQGYPQPPQDHPPQQAYPQPGQVPQGHPPQQEGFPQPAPPQQSFGQQGFGQQGFGQQDFGQAPPAPDVPAGFDAAMPSNDAPGGPPPGPGEGTERVQQLLDEGQNLFNQGDYQGSIDVWSRIFLIDIDHAEASNRIEEAREKKAELERKAEEIFHNALDQIESEQLEDAKTTLRQVLGLQPAHARARDYLEQLEAGQVPVVQRSETPDAGAAVDLLDDGGLGSFDSAQGDTGAAPDMDAAVARDRVVVVKRTDKKLLTVAAAVGLFVIAGGGFLAMKWDDLFPNTDSTSSVPRPARMDPIERATKMYEAGQVENAVNQLEKVAPDDPAYEQAQALVTQWRAEIEAPAEDPNAGPSEEMVERRRLLLEAAREAHGIGNFIRARKYFERANKILPLEAEDQALRRDCDYRLEPLQAEILLFGDGEYEEVIPVLWRKLDEDENNPDIRLLLVDSYYNLALTDLQRNNAADAAEKLAEALEVDPENADLQRIRLFAETYKSRSVDLLYRIYVKYLPSRS